MPLERGTRFGPYEVVAPLGAGGMGEVCRARDTKLQRDVALKVLSDAFVADPGRAARFQREAQLLATLNHPHIAAIYGLEESPAQAGHYVRRAIVMELVEGQTLAEVIGRGPMPLAEALPLAKQIAEALEYAHEKGVIHRDLKPANIKVTPEGTVKVLDFGLAKALGDGSDSSIDPGSSMSPTLSLAASYAGVILGTAAYMAPEQAKGKTVDRRADVWAFGVVLYEMLTGRRMFAGDSIAETLAGVIKEPIALGTLPADAPPPIRRLLDRCLDRDVRRRLQSIAEARIVIEDLIAGVSAGSADAHRAQAPMRRRALPWALAAVAVLAAAGIGAWAWPRPAPSIPPVARFLIPPPDGAALTASAPNAPQIAISPDGRLVAFLADEPGRERTIWIRALDSLSPRRLEHTEGASYPFWSPDSRHVAYFAAGKLMRLPAAGGTPTAISDAPAGEGGTWSDGDGDGVIVFAPLATGPLHRVSARGGTSSPVTTLASGQVSHSFPQFLPDGERFLYLAEGRSPGIYVQSLTPGSAIPVLDVIGRALFSPPDLLLYMRDNTLLAQRLNLDSLRLEGDAVTIAEGVRSGAGNGRNAFSVSDTGMLVYRETTGGGFGQVAWYTRAGKPAGVVLPPGDFTEIQLSPDERLLVVMRGDGIQIDLWVKDLESGVLSRLTAADGREAEAAWSPDSRRVAYIHVRDGKRTFFETTIGSGKHVPIPAEDVGSLWMDDWTADGRHLVLHGDGGGRVFLVPVARDSSASPVPVKPQQVFDESYGVDLVRVSPDGKWAAYTSFESGRAEVAIASFPAFTDRRQISSGGAVQPLWRADGRELFFLAAPQTLSAVEVSPSGATGPVRTLFPTSIAPAAGTNFYAVSRDGQRFLIREPRPSPGGAVVESLHVVTNWPSLLAPSEASAP
jgi:Tol biopolymer transport system component